MPRFFIKQEDIGNNNTITISGDNAVHISRSLRMKIGDEIVLCDYNNFEYICEISDITQSLVIAKILEKRQSQNEPDVKVTLYQALPKGAKFELIIQKCVELGIYEIVPVISSRCISRPDENSFEKKCKRWNIISSEASKQSGRAIVPKVCEPISFEDAVFRMHKADIKFMCYEAVETIDNSLNIKDFLKKELSQNKNLSQIAFFVGPEGGISPEEAQYAISEGVSCVGLGKRILRTETAPLCVLSCIMYQTDNLK